MGLEFLELTEHFELEGQRHVSAEVEFAYNREKGLYPQYTTWLDEKNDLMAFSSLPWNEQVWLIQMLDIRIKRHCTSNYEKAFQYFELKGV